MSIELLQNHPDRAYNEALIENPQQRRNARPGVLIEFLTGIRN